MSSCENSTGVGYWLSVRVCDLAEWARLLAEQQRERVQAIKEAMKKQRRR